MSEPHEQMIELTIEALTGTVYDLCVSPFETILGIKMKIQRLEGIPIYQQQLVHGNTELHDEFCLDEYSIGSGAQLKLLVAMRGGPIHAHRVQLEDPTLLEIADVLEQDGEHKYTVMVLRDDEDGFEVADLVEVVGEDSPGHVSPIPQTTSSHDPETASSIALSKMTRTKMQDLMSRLRNSTRKSSSLERAESGSQLQQRGPAKVIILDSRCSSRLLHSSAPSPSPSHPTMATPTSSKVSSTVHRKLVFPAEVVHDKKDGVTERRNTHGEQKRVMFRSLPPSLDSKGTVSSDSSSNSSSSSSRVTEATHKQTDRQRQWRRRQRLRRPSGLADSKATKHTHAEVSELVKEMTQLRLRETGKREKRKMADPLLPKLPFSSSSSYSSTHHNSDSSTVPSLPEISVGHAPCLAGNGRGHHQRRPHCAMCGKKVGLASTYNCRCGGMFCSRHRYAETHNCSFDYKRQGRETIAQSNPLVIATKLPKI